MPVRLVSTELMKQLKQLMVPAEGSEPLHFKSIYAASTRLQGRACMERAVIQVRQL